ncbi:oligosaccharide flippase family protein [Sphingomonas sp. KRR8]|uniref:oligosaccharide flippase family protein n=1 Tax=Sphingomonas sp. KRR8 TaxID=2942996 RepID=UPI00202115FA|nr:oligosaccharide flippase family protein [Sphingomonas sp. KRR8]URD61540.1 oligosaccharide flippase family protein [Sphingomonas sp. KRR8]
MSTYAAQAAIFLITFSSTIVVARLVSPRDFGVFAMANAVSTVINVFMQFGLAKYVMRESELDRDTLRSLFTVNVLMTLLYVGAILVGSATAGRLFGSVEVGRFLLVFALFPLLGMLEFIPSAICARDMRFGIVSVISVAKATVTAIATIVLASRGHAYMSFAWGQILGWAVTATCYNAVVWRPDVWRLRFKGIRSILHFGSQMIGISGLANLSTRAGEMLLGSFLGLASLGLYTRASSLPTTLYQNIYGAGSNVIFSKLSHDLREQGAFHETYVRFMRLLLGLLWPMMIGLAILAQPVIHLLYGPKWQAAATPLSLLTLASAVTIAIGMVAEVFILRHETKQQVRIEAIRSGAGIGLFALGALVSLPLAAAAKLAEALLAFLLYRRPMNRLVGGPAGELRRVYAEGLLVSAAAVLPALGLMLWTRFSPETGLLPIIASVLAGVLLWSLLLLRRKHPIATEILALVNRVR